MLEGIFWLIIHLILKWFSGLLLNYSVMDDSFWNSSDSKLVNNIVIIECCINIILHRMMHARRFVLVFVSI